MSAQGSRNRQKSLSVHEQFNHQLQLRQHQRRLDDIRYKRVSPSPTFVPAQVSSLSTERRVGMHRQIQRLNEINNENENLVKRLVEININRSKNPLYCHVIDESIAQRARSKADLTKMHRKKHEEMICFENERLVKRLVERIHSSNGSYSSQNHRFIGEKGVSTIDDENQLNISEVPTINLPPIAKPSTETPLQRLKDTSNTPHLLSMIDRSRNRTPVTQQREKLNQPDSLKLRIEKQQQQINRSPRSGEAISSAVQEVRNRSEKKSRNSSSRGQRKDVVAAVDESFVNQQTGVRQKQQQRRSMTEDKSSSQP